MMYIRKLSCFVLVMVLLLSCTQIAFAEARAVRLEDPTETDQLYGAALEFFSNNEETIRAAAAKLLESGEKGITISYHKSPENGEIETYVYKGTYDGNDELSDEEYQALANCSKDLPIDTLSSYGKGVDVSFKYYYFDASDFLRVHQCGYYYIPTIADESATLEEILEDCLSERWTFQMETMDEYQIVRISDDFVYYHWHG